MFLLERSKSWYPVENLGLAVLTAVSMCTLTDNSCAGIASKSSYAWMGTCRQQELAFEAGVLNLRRIQSFQCFKEVQCAWTNEFCEVFLQLFAQSQ